MSNAERCRRYQERRKDHVNTIGEKVDALVESVNMLFDKFQQLMDRVNMVTPPNGFPLKKGLPPAPPSKETIPFLNPPQQKPPQRRATRLPADFHVPIEWRIEGGALRAKAGLTPINLDLEADHFVDFWHAKGGKDGCKLDWRATWRNWCRNAKGTNGKFGAAANGKLDDSGLHDGPTEPAPKIAGRELPMDRPH